MPEFACPPDAICRPTFWNIPVWMQITLYALSVVSIGIFALGFLQHILFWRRGKGSYGVKDIPQRIKNFLTLGVATKKSSRKISPRA